MKSESEFTVTDNDPLKYEQPDHMEVRAKLIPKAVRDLTDEASDARMSVTDVFNRSLRLYRFLMNAERLGREICLKDPRTGEIERVTIEPDQGSTKQ